MRRRGRIASIAAVCGVGSASLAGMGEPPRPMCPHAGEACCGGQGAGGGGLEGGGAVETSPLEECIPDAERQFAAGRIQEYILRFGPLSTGDARVQPPPLTFYPQGGTLWRDLFTSNFVDLDPTSPGILDFECTNHTYDGHRGNDTLLRTFAEQRIGVPVYAAADGIVISMHDGEPDENTTCMGLANHVIIDHGLGRLGLYWHFRTDTILVSVGQTVAAGQELGLVGSSGCSNYPHLHLELWDGGATFESYAGSCRPGPSGWETQTPIDRSTRLWDFGVTHEQIAGLYAPPAAFPRSGQIALGDPFVRLWAFIMNLPPNSTWRVLFQRPDGSFAFSSPVNTFSFSGRFAWALWSYNIPDMHTITGTWHIHLYINGQLQIVAPIEVVQTRDPEFNRAPNPIGAAFDPAAPRAGEAVACRVQTSLTLDDPDYDVVRYEYVWLVNGAEVRRTTTAGHADFLPRTLLTAGAVVECTVTPSDGRAEGPSASASVMVLPPLEPDCNGNRIADSVDISSGLSLDGNGNGIPDECESAVLYVDAGATGLSTGLNWADAYPDLQSALQVAGTSPLPGRQIWVAAGVYRPDSGSGDRRRFFELPDGARVLGGFAGFESSAEDRDPAMNTTILSGDLAGDDGPAFANNGENAYRVVTASGARDVVLDGFTITGANADGPTADLQNGGGVFIEFATIQVINCRIVGNRAVGGGAGARAWLDSEATFINCLFAGNQASLGGAISLRGSTGGIVPRACTARLINCTIADNSATTAGGAVFGNGGILDAELVNCVLWGNTAPLGPQIRVVTSHPSSTRLAAAWSLIQGGAALVSHDPAVIIAWGPGNLDLDPMFTATATGDYSLLAGSPGIDAGDNAAIPATVLLDLAGRPRFHDDPGMPDTGLPDPSRPEFPIVDLGALEFQGDSTPPPPPPCAADWNDDGEVNSSDISAFLTTWIDSVVNGHLEADFNNDEVVNSTDISAFITAWLEAVTGGC